VDLGLLLNLPLESVAVRVVVASVAGVLLLRLLLRLGVRSISARVAMALAPAAALVTVVLVSWRGQFQLPELMIPAEAIDALAIPVSDGYLHFAPIAVPLLMTIWALVAVARIVRRGLSHRRARRMARMATGQPSLAVGDLVARVAARLGVVAPGVVVADRCPGGAYVVGSRRPVIVIGRDLLERLDVEEVEGVLAHEIAHVRRRDNLVATVLGAVRDVAFFVPGGRWAVAQLHRERERAADQLAVGVTARPGALASGLLKTLEGPGPAHPCAALAPAASLVERVTELVEDPTPVPRVRRRAELAAVVGTTVVAVVVGVALPAALTGAERQRDAVAVVWSTGSPAPTDAATPVREARAFDVYRDTRLEVDGPRPAATAGSDESSLENRPSTWRACADPATCPAGGDGLGLGIVPRPTITLDDELPWQATPAFPTDLDRDGLHVPTLYWLQRVS
jgi:Zn-dependent protease with chaperone function